MDEDLFDEGFMFDGSSIAGWKSIDQSDMKLIFDPASVYIDPFYARKTLCVHLQRRRTRHRRTLFRDPRGTALKAEAYLKSSASATAISAPRPSSSCSTTCAIRSPPEGLVRDRRRGRRLEHRHPYGTATWAHRAPQGGYFPVNPIAPPRTSAARCCRP